MASPSSTYPVRALVYVGLVIIAGVAASIASVRSVFFTHPPGNDWYYLTLLTLFSGFLSVRFQSIGARFSVSETFVFSGTLIYGQAVGTVLVLLDAIVLSAKIWYTKRRLDTVQTPFNLAAPPLSVWLASYALHAIAGPSPLTLASAGWTFAYGLVVFTVLYFSLNAALVSTAIALTRSSTVGTILRDIGITWWGIKHLGVNYLAGASIASLIASGDAENVSLRLLVIIPLMAVFYLTYRQSARQVDEIQERLEAIERVHMSTIKAFAMAIDAKDQVTHGHIRRVQQYTMEVARHLGVKDEKQLRAIEAAALLHDTGKLAIPEYILNKPGPLTPSEFEKMKEHAAVGANILKSIDFPYPVAPIVRHHHENWDGRGYPDGLRGQEIPLGARILSVVDCYDALTSDRPYRPRMTRQQAEQILLDRRGSMYDPWVVDGFVEILDKLEEIDEAEGRNVAAEAGLVRTSRSPALDVISAATAEEREFAELRRELPKAASLNVAVEVFFRHVRRVIPAASVVFYVPMQGNSELMPMYCSGSGSSTIESIRIAVGERISGWAYAHRQAVFNSDAALDIGPVARALPVPLRSALVCPVIDGEALLGVAALYGSEDFKKDHHRMLESAAQLLASGISGFSSAHHSPRSEAKEQSTRKVH
ncbi:MAG: HD domain-containing phosphohydrolase [Vicinamibacterales bacterium]|jgi:putative nucleotidyltransferase with HDIG domain